MNSSHTAHKDNHDGSRHAPIAIKTPPSASHGFYREVGSAEELLLLMSEQKEISRCAFRSIDFNSVKETFKECVFHDCMFMGCTFFEGMKDNIDGSNLVFSHIDVPYNTFRNDLYTASTLYEGYRKGEPESYQECYDGRVYRHYLGKGKTTTDMKETLARTLHDHAISDALHDLLAQYDERHIVGIMGGHGILRTSEDFLKVTRIAKGLTEEGRLMVSGGGPGAMEATHLGAWMAGRTDNEVSEAMNILAAAPSFKDERWLDTAFEVINRFPQSTFQSIGVPTWLYGHEPATPFATHIAKYFDNALREDGILTIAKGGIIYSPGSAGTMQEIFQDATQNHYLSFGYASPMAFLGRRYWTEEMPVYPMLCQMMEEGRYKNLMLSISDSVEDTCKALTDI